MFRLATPSTGQHKAVARLTAVILIGYGTVYSVGIDGTGYTVLHTFTYNVDGAYPDSGLLAAGNTLYGTTINGGQTPTAQCFRSAPTATLLCSTISRSKWKHSLGYVVRSGNTFYGTTLSGGSSGYGTVFSAG